jgi:hypothetical protein
LHYRFDDQRSSKQASSPIGAVVGGLVGGLVVIALLAFVIWYIRRRRTADGSPSHKTQLSSYTPSISTESSVEPSLRSRRLDAVDNSSQITVIRTPFNSREEQISDAHDAAERGRSEEIHARMQALEARIDQFRGHDVLGTAPPVYEAANQGQDTRVESSTYSPATTVFRGRKF